MIGYVHPLYTGPPRRAVPDLERAEPDQGAPALPPRTPRLMVRFTDCSWALCWIGPWQRRGTGWIVRLAWGESGVIRDGWFHYDPRKIAPSDQVDA
jgi:hypothetical protein